jgi:hypothetical protein
MLDRPDARRSCDEAGFAAIPFAVALSSLAAAGAARGGAGQPLPWDQEKVAAEARDLAAAVRGLRRSARDQPPNTIASGQAAARMRLLDRLRLIEGESRHLSHELARGVGRDETLPVFERLDLLRLRAAEDARRMFLPKATIDMMQRARGHLEAMRAYYTGEEDPRPGLVGPTRE